MLGFTPTGNQPVQVYDDKPKKRTGLKIFLALLFTLLVAVGVATYIYKESIFQPAWAHKINGISQRYNTDSDAFTKAFEGTDMTKLVDETSSAQIGRALADSKDILNKITVDVLEGVSEIGTEVKSVKLSIDEREIVNNYKTCFDGRKKGVEYLSTGLYSALQYVEAFNYLQSYEIEIKNFKEKRDLLTQRISEKSASTTDAVTALHESALAVKGYIDSAETIFKFESLKAQSLAYGTIADGLNDMNAAFPKKDVKLLAQGAAKLAEGSRLIDSVRGQTAAESQKWYLDTVQANYLKANEELDKVKAACLSAESASHLDKESSKVTKFINRVRGR